MTPMAAPPPTKKRKLSKTEKSVCNKKELKSSFGKFGDDRKKVWSDLKHETRGMLQTCQSFIKKVKEDMAKASYASHHNHSKHRPKHSYYQFSSLLKAKNLQDLLPSSKFHSVRRRTPFSCKIEHIRTDASSHSPNGHELESKVGAAANSRAYLDVPISMRGAHSGTFPLVSQNFERAATGRELFPVCGVERKHSDKGTDNLDFKGSILDGRGSEVRRKITKSYVRNKYREPFFKHERPDLYALHLLADIALDLGSEPTICHVQLQKQEGESRECHDEHAPLSTNSKGHAFSVDAERNGGEEPISEAAFDIHKDLRSDDVSFNAHVSPEVCTSIDETQNLNLDLKKKDKELISNDNHSINPHMAEVATNADRRADGAENECIDCHSSMRAQPPALEGFQTKESKDSVHRKEVNQVSSAWREPEPSSTYRENSRPSILTCMETTQKSEGYPISSSTKSFFDTSLQDSLNSKGCPSSFAKFRNQNPGYRVQEIVQSSKLKATRMVDAAIKVMSSMKAGDDAYAMIGEALDSAGIHRAGARSRISRLQPCSYRQNGGPGDCHRDLSCNPAEVASIVHSIHSTAPPKLISACVAALLMIQACGNTGIPPAEAMEILEHAATGLRPQYSQNLHIYREIEGLMSIIKTQVLSLVRTPGSNLQM